MGASFYRLRCEVFQNLFLSPMNTGFVRPAVATVPTACGIETHFPSGFPTIQDVVATVPTACGIETTLIEIDDMYQRRSCNSIYCLRY